MTKVKICGITNLEDAIAAVEFGADMLGFNFYEKSPRYIAPGTSRNITEKLEKRFGDHIPAVGVFVNADLDKILRIAIDTDIAVIQLHGDETPDFCENVHDWSGGVGIVKGFRVNGALTIKAIEEYPIRKIAEYHESAGILLDAHSPMSYGGTGEVSDWNFARQVSEIFARVYLAGGLTAENVAEAIRTVRPYAVDVASGVESSPGKKDPKKVEAFIRYAKNA